MATGPVDRERHLPAPLKPSAKHQIMLSLVGAMPFDPRDQPVIVGPARAHRIEDAIDGGVTAVFIVDVDRAQQLQIPTLIPPTHSSSRPALTAGPFCASESNGGVWERFRALSARPGSCRLMCAISRKRSLA